MYYSAATKLGTPWSGIIVFDRTSLKFHVFTPNKDGCRYF